MTEKGVIGHLKEFDHKTCNWGIYKARLQQYFIANRISDAKIKRAVLLNICSESIYQLIYNLCVPEAPETKTYEELEAFLDEHSTEKACEFVARYKFYNAKKHQDESIME